MRASIRLDSRNALANRIMNKRLSKESARKLIDFVIGNHSNLWKDNLKASEPENSKWVRSAHNTELGKLLRLVDRCVLAPLDPLLPNFVYGGRKGVSNITAALQLLGYEKERSLLALDIKRFFESVDIARVEKFYLSAKCAPRFAESLALLSCVPRGAKDRPEDSLSLARGFSTSTRLATWSYITTFYKVHNLVIRRLKSYDPRIAIFVDDIGITASRVPEEVLRKLGEDINAILKKDSDGALCLNKSKTTVSNFRDGIEHLGVRMNRNKLVTTKDFAKKRAGLEKEYSKTKSSHIKLQLRGLRAYEQSVRKAKVMQARTQTKIK